MLDLQPVYAFGAAGLISRYCKQGLWSCGRDRETAKSSHFSTLTTYYTPMQGVTETEEGKAERPNLLMGGWGEGGRGD